jgi:hypothetical protein
MMVKSSKQARRSREAEVAAKLGWQPRILHAMRTVTKAMCLFDLK